MNLRRTWIWPLAVVAIGAGATLAAAANAAMSTRDALELWGIASGVTLFGLVVGWIAWRAARARPLAGQLVVLSLTTVVSLMGGAYAAARAMFISPHDLQVLTVVLLAASSVGIAAALFLGQRMTASTDALLAVARRVGAGRPAVVAEPISTAATPELARLGDELDRMQARLAEARRSEQRLDASRRELVAWVSHDLRTPLAGMRAVVEALQDGIVHDPPTVERYLRTLHDEVENLSALVDDLFELSRTQAGALQLQLARVSLRDLVSDAIAGSEPVAAAKGVRLVGRVVGPPPEVAVSAPEVLRALRNLLVNAIRHTPSDGSVTVEAGVDDSEPECVYVAVRDTGGGVPDAELPRVFDVAFQGDAARTPGSGAGLGLAIAKGFVEAHRGQLTVHNEDGGACFTMRLPKEATVS